MCGASYLRRLLPLSSMSRVRSNTRTSATTCLRCRRYLPPYWIHHVIAENTTISYNVWCARISPLPMYR